MGNAAFIAGYFAATLLPATITAALVLLWRRTVLGAVLAVVAGLLAAWLGLGLFVRLAFGPDFMAPMD